MIEMNDKPSIDNRADSRHRSGPAGLRLCLRRGRRRGARSCSRRAFVRTSAGLPLEARLDQIAVDMETLLDKLKPTVVAVEEVYSHYAHPRTAILMGHARGDSPECAARRHRGQELLRHADQEIADRQRPRLEGTDAADDPDGAGVAARCRGRRTWPMRWPRLVLCES